MLSGCKNKDVSPVSGDGFYFDTLITISVTSDRGEDLLAECFSICEDLEATFSRTAAESELYAINHRIENTLKISNEMAFLIEKGLMYYEMSDGLLDITIAPLLTLWDFKAENPSVPDADEIAQAAAKVDASRIHLDGNTLTFDSSDTEIDLGALAKGYAADQLKAYLTEQGVESGIINLGGNVLTIGKKPDKSLWNVGIQRPFAFRSETITTIKVDGKSVVSAGIYERYFETEGVCWHHILDPFTGYPVETDLWQATIISAQSLEGDALSTICILKGEEEAKQFIEELQGVKAVFVSDKGELS